MKVPMQSVRLERRSPDWLVAAIAGFAAGAVLMVLDLFWSSVVEGGGPWKTSYMIAPIFMGPEILQSPGFPFKFSVVAVALATHYVIGILFGQALAAILAPLNLDSSIPKALVTGAVFGGVVYLLNFYVMSNWFPWLADLRGWATVAAHLVFGTVAAFLYWKLERTAKER